MGILLGVFYWFGGFILAIPISVGIGFLLCACIGIFNIFRYKWTWALILGYLFGAVISYLIVVALFLVFGFIGDRTEYENQTVILAGLAFPGIMMLKVIPPFVKLALRQTKGSLE